MFIDYFRFAQFAQVVYSRTRREFPLLNNVLKRPLVKKNMFGRLKAINSPN